MSRTTRRTFLKQATAAGIATTFAISSARSAERILGANDRVRLGIAGINGRGGSHMNEFGGMKDVEVAYLIDPDIAAAREPRRTNQGESRQHAQVRSGHPPGARRQRPGRRLRGDLQSLALPDHLLGLPGRQGRVCREADAATTCSKAGNASRRPRSTSGSCSTARRAAARGNGPRRLPPSPAASTASCWSPRATPPRGSGPLDRRLQAGQGTASRLRFQPLARPRP